MIAKKTKRLCLLSELLYKNKLGLFLKEYIYCEVRGRARTVRNSSFSGGEARILCEEKRIWRSCLNSFASFLFQERKEERNIFYKKHLLLLFILLSINSLMVAQKVAVYKTNDLLKRIYNNSDTLYVVNFWATWCKPCVAELPDFEAVNKECSNLKVKVLLVTLDFKDDLKKRVKPFLKQHQYKTEVVLLDETNGNDFINQIAEQWSGAIPATIITQKNKTRFEFYEKKLSYEFLKEALNQH